MRRQVQTVVTSRQSSPSDVRLARATRRLRESSVAALSDHGTDTKATRRQALAHLINPLVSGDTPTANNVAAFLRFGQDAQRADLLLRPARQFPPVTVAEGTAPLQGPPNHLHCVSH